VIILKFDEVQDVELILVALRKMPMEVAEDMVMKIRAQAIPQIQAQQAQPAPDAETVAEEAPAQAE
jgi:hypothetical protein